MASWRHGRLGLHPRDPIPRIDPQHIAGRHPGPHDGPGCLSRPGGVLTLAAAFGESPQHEDHSPNLADPRVVAFDVPSARGDRGELHDAGHAHYRRGRTSVRNQSPRCSAHTNVAHRSSPPASSRNGGSQRCSARTTLRDYDETK